MSTIPAAGTVPWRRRNGTLEVALVHRPRYDDWSWAKGKLDPGEEWAAAAVRETAEETGLEVRLGRPLPEAGYTVLTKEGVPDTKVVRYWAAEVSGGHGRLDHEIDEVAWLDVQLAFDRLDYSRDRDQLLAVVRADQALTLETWPLLLIRHAKSVPRSAWTGRDDTRRPLDRTGSRRASDIVPVIAAYGVTRLVTSPSVRCVQTIAPYAGSARLPLRERFGLAEEGYAADPAKAPRHLVRLFERGEPAAVCSHGPVLPDLVDVLSARVDPEDPANEAAVETLGQAREEKLDKGEVLVCHVAGTGMDARIVAVERHRT
jgi:8-oxo-dGTP diphosphatase